MDGTAVVGSQHVMIPITSKTAAADQFYRWRSVHPQREALQTTGLTSYFAWGWMGGARVSLSRPLSDVKARRKLGKKRGEKTMDQNKFSDLVRSTGGS